MTKIIYKKSSKQDFNATILNKSFYSGQGAPQGAQAMRHQLELQYSVTGSLNDLNYLEEILVTAKLDAHF